MGITLSWRNPDCGIVIPVTSVSREHAEILRTSGKYFIEDKKSRNGTFVNNQAINGTDPSEEQRQDPHLRLHRHLRR